VRIYITFFFILILFAIAFVFGSQNEQIISLNYLIARTELSIAAAVSLFTGIGVVLGLLISMLWRLIRSVQKKRAVSKHV
jgi:putative membrane protein